MGTISDVKSHKAEATMASLLAMFGGDLKDCKTLYIISDSPTSQYRNKKMCFLIKKWAVENGVDIYWIYMQSGHGKGPMDGVGCAIKQVITDTIAYHPMSVIRNTEQLMAVLPEMCVELSTYENCDVKTFIDQYPTPLRKLPLIQNFVFGIASCHEVFYSSVADNQLKWKKISSDLYTL